MHAMSFMMAHTRCRHGKGSDCGQGEHKTPTTFGLPVLKGMCSKLLSSSAFAAAEEPLGPSALPGLLLLLLFSTIRREKAMTGRGAQPETPPVLT